MKNLIVATVLALVPAPSFATETSAQQQPTKTIFCAFTEPFYTLDINLETGVIVKTEPDWENDAGQSVSREIAKGVTLKPDFSDPLLPVYKIVGQDGSEILDLKMNMQGSDGMSDITFPFTVKHEDFWGGCSTDKVKALDPHEFN